MQRVSWFRFAPVVFGLMMMVMRPARAATVPSGFSDIVVATGIQQPTAMQFAPDGRLFVSQQTGALRVVKNGALLAEPFVTLPVNAAGERGLLGLDFDPNFASNRYIYLYYTSNTPVVHNRVSRFTASAANPDQAEAGSETVILDLNPLSGATNHNGGAMHFGPDGKLYIAVGENANGTNAQSVQNLLGKILRINPDGSIPDDNPTTFTNTGGETLTPTGQNRAIYALGLRNPYTFAFQPKTGRLFINDVGQSTFEEINEGVKGANYGWPTTEGPTDNLNVRAPLFFYRHQVIDDGFSCAVTGGTFYDPPTQLYPNSFVGQYFFADYCGGWIRSLDPSSATSASFARNIAAPVDLKVGPDGALYYIEYQGGSVRKIAYALAAPNISLQPVSITVAPGATASFRIEAAGDGLKYQWQRNEQPIPDANAPTYSFTATVADNGAKFRCVVSNAGGSVNSDPATLTVTEDHAPIPVITAPREGTVFKAGQTFRFEGRATDQEDGELPASAFTWRVDYHTGDAPPRPFVSPLTGVKSGQFTIPTRTPYTLSNVFYRIHLTVRDASGREAEVTRDILPLTVLLRFRTNPPGLALSLEEGSAPDTPFEVRGVVGIIRNLSAPAPQDYNGVSYVFDRWSDGGAQSHEITTPESDTTYTAYFRRAGTAPGIVISTPANEGFYRALTTASGTTGAGATDVRVSLFRYESTGAPAGYFNGSTWTSEPTLFAAALNDGRWSLALPTREQGLVDTRYLLRAVVRDSSGERAASVRFVIDRANPRISITAPTEGQTLVTLERARGLVSDPGLAGVSYVRVLLYRAATTSEPAGYWNGRAFVPTLRPDDYPRATLGSDSWSFLLPRPAQGLVPANYGLRAYAFDRAGNSNLTPVVRFRIGSTP